MFCRRLDELNALRAEIAEVRSIFLDVVTTLRMQAEASPRYAVGSKSRSPASNAILPDR